MKLIISASPYLTIATLQHFGVRMPTWPTCIVAGISAFVFACILFYTIGREIEKALNSQDHTP